MTRHAEAARSWDRAVELDAAVLDDEELAFQCSVTLAQVGRYDSAAEILGQVLARGVSNLAFDYLDKDGNATTITDDLRVVRISFDLTAHDQTMRFRSAALVRNI